jgi:hypothetical protein
VVIDLGAPRVVARTNAKAPTGNPTFMVLPDGDPDKEAGLKSVVIPSGLPLATLRLVIASFQDWATRKMSTVRIGAR